MALTNYNYKSVIDANIAANIADNFSNAITASDVRAIFQEISDSFKHKGDTVSLTDAATVDWDIDHGDVAMVTLGGNRTIAEPTNPRIGQRITLMVVQDGTGSRTVTWDGWFVFDSTPTLSTGANRMDVFEFVVVDNGAGDTLGAMCATPIIGVYSSTGGSGGGPWAPAPV